MTSALAQVRAELGVEAVILSQRRLDEGVELMVAEGSPDQQSVHAEVSLSQDIARLQREVSQLKSLLVDSSQSPTTSEPGERRAVPDRKLLSLGLSRELVKRLRSLAGSSAWRDCLAELPSQLNTLDEDLVARGGVFVLVGPTGSGKSTTIAKLAASYVLANGADDVALVTMDTYGIAAHEQLRALGRILKVPVKVVDRQHSLERVLHDLRHKSLVLVDTAGLGRADKRLRQQMTRIDELGQRARSLLVLPANTQRGALEASYQAYKTSNLAACVISKLDDAVGLGEVLSFCAERSLPLAYTTDGQEVPDAIAIADGDYLVRRMVDKGAAKKDLSPALLSRVRAPQAQD